MTARPGGIVQSVHDRLVSHAKSTGVDPNLVYVRFAMERFLYRLSRSRHAPRFILKGGLLLLVWLGENIRPTRDADLLGFGDLSDQDLVETFTEICAIEVEPDGMSYIPSSIQVTPIRVEDPYGGKRVTLQAHLGKSPLRIQVDVGIGDAITPEPEWLDYPSLLGFPRPRLRAYRPETAIAEKVHAMVVLGSKNSRMRDFFDVYTLAHHLDFDGDQLVSALRGTFERRGTSVPDDLPLALTPAFVTKEKQAQWQGFLRKNRLTAVPQDLEQIVVVLEPFLGPILAATGRGSDFQSSWPAGGPWEATP